MNSSTPPTEFNTVWHVQYIRVQTEGTTRLLQYIHHFSHHHSDSLSSAVLRLTNALLFCKVSPGFVIITPFSFSAEKPKKCIQRCVRALKFNMTETNGLKVCPLLHLTPYHLESCKPLKPKDHSLSNRALFLQLVKP